MKQSDNWKDKLVNLVGKINFWIKLKLGKILQIEARASIEKK